MDYGGLVLENTSLPAHKQKNENKNDIPTKNIGKVLFFHIPSYIMTVQRKI